mgnify:CR=1 FL=1
MIHTFRSIQNELQLTDTQIQFAADAHFSTRPGLAIRKWSPANVARIGLKVYVAQAVIGFAIGFTIPILQTIGVF